jgi:hypothetical protein
VEAARTDLEWTNNHRDAILAWLRNIDTGGSGNIATNKIVITIAFITASLYSTQIFN